MTDAALGVETVAEATAEAEVDVAMQVISAPHLVR
jgi:hypothetical protein